MNSKWHFTRVLLTVFVTLCSGCWQNGKDPALDLPLIPAPPDTHTFFTPGIDPGILYSYITDRGQIFVYRRDIDKYAWVTLPQFKLLVAHAANQPGRIVYSLEDGDLHHPDNRAAFMVIHESGAHTQDPIDILPLVKRTRPAIR